MTLMNNDRDDQEIGSDKEQAPEAGNSDASRRKLMLRLAAGAFVAPSILVTLGAGPASASP